MMVLWVWATCAAVRRGVTPPGFTLPVFFVLNNLEVILFGGWWVGALRFGITGQFTSG